MNAYEQRLDVSVEGYQIEEVLNALLHGILLHRTNGKVLWSNNLPLLFTMGSLGMEDVDCETFDFTYVRISSEELQSRIQSEIYNFSQSLRSRQVSQYSENDISGKIELKFYQKSSDWTKAFSQAKLPWEVWTIHVHVLSLSTELDRQALLRRLPDELLSLTLTVTEAIKKHDKLPSANRQQDEEGVYDTSLSDCEPYLFELTGYASDETNSSNAGVGATMKKILEGTLSFGRN